MRDPGLLIKPEEMIANNVYICRFIRRPAAEDGLNFIREESGKI